MDHLETRDTQLEALVREQDLWGTLRTDTMALAKSLVQGLKPVQYLNA